MRLKKLQVSGFKSFVDSTDIRLPSHLVAVVGPNGCGKSNVIDAVRWVMGESSAKMLRGDSMADVIFNGSSARKPVGKASVELVFDNSDGRAEGSYAQFAEISVKRTLTRDGQSSYFINNLKTRRRDVLDLFRGTGLGPRSYSIIEQGMVSRIVEARPEDLRVFVEEAAGTSRYKDRRRETETRIAHTRDNLDRVADIRDELAKQLRRLKRQSAAARRYKVLKQEERTIAGQLQVLKLRGLDGKLEEQDRETARRENEHQAALTDLRQIESELESVRKEQGEAQEKANLVQREHYQTGAEITNIEQRIEHIRENRQRRKEEIERLNREIVVRKEEIERDTDSSIGLKRKFESFQPEHEEFQQACDKAEAQLADAERVLQEWMSEMEAFNEQSRIPAQQIEVQKSHIEYLEKQQPRALARRDALKDRMAELETQVEGVDMEKLRAAVGEHDHRYAQAERECHGTEQEINDLNEELQQLRDEAAAENASLQEAISRLDSLREFQEAAAFDDDQAANDWLESLELGNAPRLASRLQVSEGWERAADRVLNGFLNAVCSEQLTLNSLTQSPDVSLSLIDGSGVSEPARLDLPRLIDKIDSADDDLSSLLSGVYVADSLTDALTYRSQLMGRECIATRDGAVVGVNWASFESSKKLESGVLAREDEIKQLETTRDKIQMRLEVLNGKIAERKAPREKLESDLQSQRVVLNNLRSEMASLHSRFGREEAQFNEARDQLVKLSGEVEDISAQIALDHTEIDNARALIDAAEQKTGNLDQQRENLVDRRDVLNRQVAEKRQAVNEARDALHEKALHNQRLETEFERLNENIRRLKQDVASSEERLTELADPKRIEEESVDDLRAEMEQLLERKLAVEKSYQTCRDVVAGFDQRITSASEQRNRENNRVNQLREGLDQQKLARQEVQVRRETHLESMREQGYEVSECAAELPTQANTEEWQSSLDQLQQKIARIGPVNLVAIEEFEEESERMEYLDRQHADLSEALETLESVIRKIDRETRSRFRETFDRINAGFNEFFPKLFGGGSAELYLTSDDLLTAGITVMARPPGKRNSHIHLLSGGEKALTAVALLFSLFKLHPAPFCMLDEVDAPLDDANVDRYCETLKTLANMSQMIVITHNKITMEAMDMLVGVTMAEAGVSRLVSVDIEQAVEMVSQ